jgi:16S rRNA (cytosine967-C5)-methyltransferase
VKSKKRSLPPTVSPARAAAFDVLRRVESESSYASELLHSKTCASLTTLDHSLATELVMGVLRWRSVLDAAISQSSSQPLAKLDLEVLTALRIAVYQLRFLTRIPQRASINESVELVKRARKRSAAPFVNAVLRKLAANFSKDIASASVEIAGDSAKSLAAAGSHPVWLVERWAETYGIEVARSICTYNQRVPSTAIRLRDAGADAGLRADGIELDSGALLASARRVQQGDVTSTTAFREGLCVIQDEGSQLVAALAGHGMRILDCCAAPGGKTLALADHNPDAQIIAAELHHHRARLLRRLIHASHPAKEFRNANIFIVAADARHLPFSASFDSILVDVPCSGTGTLSRNPEIKWRLTDRDLLDLQRRQVEILHSAIAQVSVGGRVIYSTCSLEREENETVVERAMAESPWMRVVNCAGELEQLQRDKELTWPDLPSLSSGPYLRTLPGIHSCDGFFAAILERTS